MHRALTDMKPREVRSPSPVGSPRPRARTLRWADALRLAPLALLTACGGVETYPQTSLVPKSDFARDIDGLFRLTLWLGVIVGILTFAAMAYIMVKYRHRPDGPQPSQVTGNTTLELLWTLLPALIIAVIAVPTVETIFETQKDAPEGALTVNVTGWQWWWEFDYVIGNDTVNTANEIHVPVGTPVRLLMTSGDVLHSFWVPQMGGKRDVIPNRVNRIVFTPEEPGVYLGACAEFCGDSHALMKMRLIAHTPEGFQEWLRNEARPAIDPEAGPFPDSALILGKQLVTAGACAGCHVIDGTAATFGKTGPNLTHLARRGTIAAGILPNNAENLYHWIDDPQRIKPGAKMPDLGLSPDEIRYIVAYLQTLY